MFSEGIYRKEKANTLVIKPRLGWLRRLGRLSIGRFCLMKIIKTFLPFFFQFYVIKDRTGVIMSKSFQRIKPTIDIFLNWPKDYVSVKERKIKKKQQKRMER